MTELRCVLCRGKNPRPATIGHACAPCRDWLDERLGDIPRKYGRLAEMLLPGAGEPQEGQRGKRDSGPLPLRVEVLNLLSPSNPATTKSTEDRTGVLPTLEVLRLWDRHAREDLSFPRRTKPATVAETVRFLRAQLDKICALSWVDDFAVEVKDAHNVLRNMHGEHLPKPVGTCPEIVDAGEDRQVCGNTLWAYTYRDSVECGACGRKWSRDDLEWLGRTMGALA